MLTIRGALHGQRQRTIGTVNNAPIILKATGHGLVSVYASLPVDNTIFGKRKHYALTGGFPDNQAFTTMIATLRAPQDENGYGLALVLTIEAAHELHRS